MSILNMNNPIGFFDSGVGGLTVLKEVKKTLPNEDFIYFGDTLHVPYGDKTKEELIDYSKNILKFLEKKGCKAVVMACNTTSSTIYEDIKDKYNFKLYPVVQSVAKILAGLDIERMGIFATKATIASGAYSKEILKFNSKMQVFGQYCPNWDRIVENNLSNNIESVSIIKSDLERMLSNAPQKIVLGCTHYPYLLPVLTKFVSKDLFIDPAEYLAQFVKDDLVKSGLTKNSNTPHFEEFYVSANPDKFKTGAKVFYEVDNVSEIIF